MKNKNLLSKIIAKNSILFVLAASLSLILSGLIVKGSQIISNSINIMLANEKMDINNLVMKTGIIIIAAMFVSFFRGICNELFSINVQRECKDVTIEAIEKAEYSFFENNAGAVINKLTSDISDMDKLLSEILPDILQYTVMIITVSVAIVKINWIIFAGIVIIFPASLFLSNRIAVKINDLAKKRRGRYDELSSIALDNIEGIEVAKAYGIENILNHRIENKSAEILKNEYARNKYQALANGITLLIKWVPTISCSLIALVLVLENIITIGELMAFLVLLGKISASISELPFRITDGREMMISVKRIQNLLNTPKEQSGEYSGEDLANQRTVVELKDISFSYKGQEDCMILNNINMKLTRGEKIAIVGASGAGKSTLLKILCGFVKNASGIYTLFGRDFREWNIDAAREQIAYVSQDAYLFPGSFAENVAYGDEDIDILKVEDACKKAGIHETINALPNGFYTEVGERGVKLSGGERQRVSIARALYKKTPIILLDEPTSALDEETQALVSKTLYEDKEKTVIVIAHRLSTIKNADRIYCMENGEIIEMGTHNELMSNKGVYAELYGREAE